MRRIISFVLFCVAFAFASPSFATPSDEASAYVQRLGDQALTVIANKNFDKKQKLSRLEKIFSSNVDIAWVGKFVMGRFWRQATDDQKKNYLKEYEKFLTKHYTERFANYSGGDFKITGSRNDGEENEFTVSMQIIPEDKNAEPILVDYRVRKGAGGFKIFDVNVEGVSMITTQRSEFASVISNHDIDYLIGKLSTMSAPDQDVPAASNKKG